MQSHRDTLHKAVKRAKDQVKRILDTPLADYTPKASKRIIVYGDYIQTKPICEVYNPDNIALGMSKDQGANLRVRYHMRHPAKDKSPEYPQRPMPLWISLG